VAPILYSHIAFLVSKAVRCHVLGFGGIICCGVCLHAKVLRSFMLPQLSEESVMCVKPRLLPLSPGKENSSSRMGFRRQALPYSVTAIYAHCGALAQHQQQWQSPYTKMPMESRLTRLDMDIDMEVFLHSVQRTGRQGRW
jgi:hypothetical protein